MTNKNKFYAASVFVFLLFLVFVFGYGKNIAFAFDFGQTREGIGNSFSYVTQFLGTAKQYLQDIFSNAGDLVSYLNPQSLLNKLDSWFENITGGVSLMESLRFIGNLFVTVLEAITGALRWVLSHI
ncbi:MAG: hypothetical protein AAB655_02810 [Patescibacteria group bacterium]